MTVTYGIICEMFSLNGELRTAYGIAVYAHSEYTGSKSIVASINDLSANRESVEDLVTACNKGNFH